MNNMEEIALKRALRQMRQEWKQDKSRASFHYAFAIRKSRVVAFGKNNLFDASKAALKIGRSLNINKWKEYPYIHAECDVITQLDQRYDKNEVEIVSLRINRSGQFRLAKPCVNCQKTLEILGYKNVWWSVNSDNNLILTNESESIKYNDVK
jgi:hypothetical protein